MHTLKPTELKSIIMAIRDRQQTIPPIVRKVGQLALLLAAASIFVSCSTRVQVSDISGVPFQSPQNTPDQSPHQGPMYKNGQVAPAPINSPVQSPAPRQPGKNPTSEQDFDTRNGLTFIVDPREISAETKADFPLLAYQEATCSQAFTMPTKVVCNTYYPTMAGKDRYVQYIFTRKMEGACYNVAGQAKAGCVKACMVTFLKKHGSLPGGILCQ